MATLTYFDRFIQQADSLHRGCICMHAHTHLQILHILFSVRPIQPWLHTVKLVWDGEGKLWIEAVCCQKQLDNWVMGRKNRRDGGV